VATAETLQILLVEDDEDDFVVTRGMLRGQARFNCEVEWMHSYDAALGAIREARHDLYLVDYRLGERTGLELIGEAWTGTPRAPVIVLTGQDDYEVDLRASELGVTDYLVKGKLDAPSLERTIRYAVRHHAAMLDLRRSEERYAVAVRATNDGIWDWDLADDTIHVSARWRTLLGYDDQILSHRPSAWFDLVHPDDVERLRMEIEHHLASTAPYFENEHRIRHADGDWRWVLTRGLTSFDDEGQPIRVTGSLSDITERRRAEQRLMHDALHDSLTGLPNRALFMDRLSQAMGHRQDGQETRCAVLFIDIDRFKLVNDSLSHTAGDRLLIELSRRIGRLLRAGDTLARMGGDEFTILLDSLDAPAQALEIAGRVAEAICESSMVEGRQLTVAASIGIAHHEAGVDDPAELVRNADIAMYAAKAHGGGRCEVFDTSMHERVISRVSLEAQLRQAIDQQQMRTFFQPIVDLRTRALHGVEALARWPDDETNVAPCDFIPVAEEAGLVAGLGRLIMSSACHTLRDWREQGLVGPEVTVSVNVSARQLADDIIVDDVRAVLAETDLPEANLVLEITESTLIENPEVAGLVLRELLGLGVSIQLDDFGTGYSSLTVLQHFPGDTLKIDREFVASMTDRAESQIIVRSIVALAHNLGLHVVAEGIENSHQMQVLTALGCEYGQGFHLARPFAADHLEAFLHQQYSDPGVSAEGLRRAS
jgi:diguanylate cyclase (GGDEF)-like protein/PAS domain S-box-containing protein